MRERLNHLARMIIDSNRYMVLATADTDGRPWVSPVWFASGDYEHFHWVSSPDARHSLNVGARPEVAITIFDSTVPVGGAQAVYMSGRAEELTGAELEAGIGIFGRLSEADVGRTWGLDDVQPPSPFRLYRAVASEHYVLIAGRDPELGTGVDRREPVAPHSVELLADAVIHPTTKSDQEQRPAERPERKRLILAADADRKRIERDLHGGVQQHLVALAMKVQLADSLAGSDPAAAKALLDELGRDLEEAVDEARRLAQRIYPPLLEVRGLAPVLRAAATSAGVPASVEVAADGSYPPEITNTVYWCWLEALEQRGDQVAITVRDEGEALAFAVTGAEAPAWLHDRVEALGGRLTTRSEPDGGPSVSVSLPT